MALRYTAGTIGKITIEQETKNGKARYQIQIRQGNALAVFVHIRKANPAELAINPAGKYIHTLYNFFADESHIKNILKHNENLFGTDKVIKCELNTYYKESKVLLKYLTKAGIKVTCYYKEDNQRTQEWNWQ